MQRGRLNRRYRIGPDTQTLEKHAHASRYILFMFYFCDFVHRASDRKHEERDVVAEEERVPDGEATFRTLGYVFSLKNRWQMIKLHKVVVIHYLR